MYNPPMCVCLPALIGLCPTLRVRQPEEGQRQDDPPDLPDRCHSTCRSHGPAASASARAASAPSLLSSIFCCERVCLTNLNWFMLLWNRSTFHLSAPTFIRNWPSLRCHIDITITITICRVCVALVTNTCSIYVPTMQCRAEQNFRFYQVSNWLKLIFQWIWKWDIIWRI